MLRRKPRTSHQTAPITAIVHLYPRRLCQEVCLTHIVKWCFLSTVTTVHHGPYRQGSHICQTHSMRSSHYCWWCAYPATGQVWPCHNWCQTPASCTVAQRTTIAQLQAAGWTGPQSPKGHQCFHWRVKEQGQIATSGCVTLWVDYINSCLWTIKGMW